MADTIISVENLGKKYRLGVARHDTLRDRLTHAIRAPFRRKGNPAGIDPEEFWALQNVSFEVKRGEVLGIIGRNGAGKSTLLKILSRITEPTKGRISIRGRVASLLEVGTGFHPELSGRENVYLNGAILGMTRAEIARKFGEIVAFAEVERFLDTPVKHYSSGMYVRLAFAVAAHLEPEILIVDEVLAVGDAQFQKKCLGKMQDVAQHHGRTVLFVSHDMSAVASLTQRTLLLHQGALVTNGPTHETMGRYYELGGHKSATYHAESPDNREPFIQRVVVHTSRPSSVQAAGEPMKVEITLEHPRAIAGACLSFQVVNQMQQPATHVWIYDSEVPYARSAGTTTLTCNIPKVRLNVGRYTLRVFFSEPEGGRMFETREGICPFEVVRLDKTTQWGWRPNACVYHEESTWQIDSSR